MTDRKTASTITDAELDELYADLARYEEVLGEMNENAVAAAKQLAATEQRADKAEAALAAVQRAARGIGAWGVLQAADKTLQQQPSHRFTARPVDPEMERIATQRAEQAAAKHERAAEQLAALNPSGSTREQLPTDILAAITVPPYLSTACQTAGACETAAGTHRTERPWLAAHAEELHDRCRLNHKFTGQLCTCSCHGEPAPAGTEATEIETTAQVFAALHRSAEQDISRVIALYEQWVKAGPPPLGTPMSRWWDARLVELHDAILPPEQQPNTDQTKEQ